MENFGSIIIGDVKCTNDVCNNRSQIGLSSRIWHRTTNYAYCVTCYTEFKVSNYLRIGLCTACDIKELDFQWICGIHYLEWKSIYG